MLLSFADRFIVWSFGIFVQLVVQQMCVFFCWVFSWYFNFSFLSELHTFMRSPISWMFFLSISWTDCWRTSFFQLYRVSSLMLNHNMYLCWFHLRYSHHYHFRYIESFLCAYLSLTIFSRVLSSDSSHGSFVWFPWWSSLKLFFISNLPILKYLETWVNLLP